MKKLLSVLFAVTIILGIFSLPAYADDYDYTPEKYTDEESQAGFSFKYIYAVIKNEYSFEEFTPEKLGSEMIEKVEVPFPFNPDNMNYSETDWELFLIIHIKEEYRTRENIVKLYKQLTKCEYVLSCGPAFMYYSLPFFPDSAESIGRYTGDYRPWVSDETADYDRNGKGMLDNPYYKLYYNGLLEHSTALYLQFADYITDVDYISYYTDTYMNADINYVTLIFDQFVALPEYEGAMYNYNMFVLEKYFSKEDILYVGDTVLSAVVAIDKENKDIIKEIEELRFIGDAFFTIRGSSLAVTGTFTLGNVEGGQEDGWDADGNPLNPHKVSAADARLILRCAAGIEKPEKELKRFYYCADMDFDGKITAADARLALRTSAGFEEEKEITFGYTINWYDYMGRNLNFY